MKIAETPFILRTDGTTKDVTPANGKTFTAEELHEFVGGYFEIVWLKGELDGYVIVLDEEGKFKDYFINIMATHAARTTRSITKSDFIVGDVLICKKEYMD